MVRFVTALGLLAVAGTAHASLRGVSEETVRCDVYGYGYGYG
jgi:hypothetical protein